MTPVEQLGSVTLPSGTLLIVDGGMLRLWAHDRDPLLPEGVLDEEGTANVNAGADFFIEGADAERAGRVFDRSWHPRYLYDVPASGIDEMGTLFASCVREHGLDARLVPLEKRVSHYQRVKLALEQGNGVGQMQFHGLWAVAIAGLPRDRALAVEGRRMSDGPDADRWREVSIVGEERALATRTEACGDILVDMARLIAIDLEALSAWEHEETLDGLADYVFWGRDAEEVARRTGATQVQSPGDSAAWGWTDGEVYDVVARGEKVEALKAGGLKFASDFRPHSHHFQVMREVRASSTGSGCVDVGGARCCMFMTSWGDGCYSVYRDLDERGRVARIRIDLGSEAIVNRQRELEAR